MMGIAPSLPPTLPPFLLSTPPSIFPSLSLIPLNPPASPSVQYLSTIQIYSSAVPLAVEQISH